MYCVNCGFKLEDSYNYCPECGEENKIRASNSPSVYLISGRTDGKVKKKQIKK